MPERIPAEHRSIVDMFTAIRHLEAAALFLPEGSRVKGEIISAANQVHHLVLRARDAINGKIYKCIGCGTESEYPFGIAAPDECGECFNKRGERERNHQQGANEEHG